MEEQVAYLGRKLWLREAVADRRLVPEWIA